MPATNLSKAVMVHRRDLIKYAGALLGSWPLQSHAFAMGLEEENHDWIVLRNNENPYGPSASVARGVAEKLKRMNRYSWEDSQELINALAQHHDLKTTQISLGAGSTELLDLLAAKTHAEKGGVVLADPSYDYWLEPWMKKGLVVKRVPVNSSKKLDLKSMAEAVDTTTKLLYICNPNNPTGTLIDSSEMLSLLESVPPQVNVVIDEAYIQYTDQPGFISLIPRFTNLVVLRSFSKIYGLAGARVGYAAAQEKILQEMDEYRSSAGGSVSVPSRWAAYYALQDPAFRERSKQENNKVRTYTTEQLKRLGIECIPSATNFLYFSLSGFPKDYFRLLEQHKIQGTRIYEEEGRWTRITVGTMAEMKKLINTLASA